VRRVLLLLAVCAVLVGAGVVVAPPELALGWTWRTYAPVTWPLRSWRAWSAARWLSYWPEKTTKRPGSSEPYSSESRIPTGMPCCASSVARVSAAALVAEASSTTVHASLPAGQSAISGVVPEPSSVAGGIVVDPGVTVGATVGAGEGVAVAAGCSATCSGSPANSTSARMTAATAMAKRTPTSATGPRQLGGAAIVEVTSAPQFRHHSCWGVRSAPQRGHRRCSGAGGWGGGVSTAVTRPPPAVTRTGRAR
jgi:hypothetical protein